MGSATTPPDCTPASIYNCLQSAGFSTVQAVGALANAIAESSLNPEANVVDSNGARSYGLWQFNAASYPSAASLVTGNCRNDIAKQVNFLASVVSGQALAGSTGAQVAGNFAANFERCQGCQAGSNAPNGWQTRVNNAATVEGWINNGNWPTSSKGLPGGGSGGNGTGTGSGGSGGATTGSRCLVGGNTFIPCLLSASQARGLIGGVCIGIGGVVFLGGVSLLLVMAGGGPGAAAGKALQKVPAVRMTSKAAGTLGKSGGNGEPKLERAETQAEINARRRQIANPPIFPAAAPRKARRP